MTWRRTLVAILLAACGESGTPSTPAPGPMPPPPPPPGPATISISAGDQQTAASQEPVAVAPAVEVRDAQGRPLPGVVVRFSVTGGGGLLEGDTPTSDAAGVARVARWRLGLTGEQTLAAQVGALTPALFRARVLAGSETVESTIGIGGGKLDITLPDHPYRGLKLEVPSGAYASAGTWRLRIAPAAALPLLPFASSSIEIDADVVLTSTSGWAHGFHTSGRKLAR